MFGYAVRMRKPATIEHMYLDFDGFFASVEQQCDSRLRGRPIGIIPYEGGHKTILIACSREAKAQGVKNIMDVTDARRICHDLVLVPQKPDLYRRAHNALIAEIEAVLPIDVVKSIDELSCRLGTAEIADPHGLAQRIKRRIRYGIGASITCSMGFAANRHLAKIACARGKPDGVMVWLPEAMPGPLLAVALADIPGIGTRMRRKLFLAGIARTDQLLRLAPKQMRALWHNVTGERLWYALHGYDIEAQPTERGMFGHARVLPPDSRRLEDARTISRLLLVKAGRRMRRDAYFAGSLMLYLGLADGGWLQSLPLRQVRDDAALLGGLATLWQRARRDLPAATRVFRVGVTMGDLTPASARQLDLLDDDEPQRRRWEQVGDVLDGLHRRFGRTVASIGPWNPPAGGNVGGKISYTRIPSAEDFS